MQILLLEKYRVPGRVTIRFSGCKFATSYPAAKETNNNNKNSKKAQNKTKQTNKQNTKKPGNQFNHWVGWLVLSDYSPAL